MCVTWCWGLRGSFKSQKTCLNVDKNQYRWVAQGCRARNWSCVRYQRGMKGSPRCQFWLVEVSLFLFSRSVLSDSVTSWTVGHQASLSFTVPKSLLKLTSIDDAVQPSHSLSSFHSPLAVNLSQHQGLFQWVGTLHQVAKVLELQHQSFQWIVRVDFL